MSKPAAKAREVLSKHGGVDLPVRVERIADRVGASISFEPFDGDVSGVAYRNGKQLLIGINSRHPLTRQRFSIAHEIGHLLLHEGRPMTVDKEMRVNRRDRTSSLATDAEEIEANAFAAELLMPAHRVRVELERCLEEGKSSRSVVQHMAAAFDVSKQAMMIRLSNLGSHIPE